MRWALAECALLLEIEELYRDAIRCLVEAFLTDRTNYADCYTWAHRAGAEVAREIGCSWTYEPGDEQYTLDCEINALHELWATSVGWVGRRQCSICRQPPMRCDHVLGRTYDGVVCELERIEIVGFDHVAMTANPEFSYTWHRLKTRSAADLLAAKEIRAAGDDRACHHCLRCAGTALGPDDGDLDPVARYDRWMRAHLAEESALAKARPRPTPQQARPGIPLLPWHPSSAPPSSAT